MTFLNIHWKKITKSQFRYTEDTNALLLHYLESDPNVIVAVGWDYVSIELRPLTGKPKDSEKNLS
jgi:hypothetical protein